MTNTNDSHKRKADDNTLLPEKPLKYKRVKFGKKEPTYTAVMRKLKEMITNPALKGKRCPKCHVLLSGTGWGRSYTPNHDCEKCDMHCTNPFLCKCLSSV